MASPGFNSALYIGGTSTAFTGEACTDISGDVWQITAASKGVWDPAVVPDFYDNGVAILAADIAAIDYLFGKVTFTGTKTGPITVDGNYIPQLKIADGYSYSVDMEADELDTTEFDDTAYSRIVGLTSVTGTFEIHAAGDIDQDPGAGAKTFDSLYQNKTLTLWAVRFTSNSGFRAWGYVSKLAVSAGVQDLIGSTVDFISTSRTDADGRTVHFSVSLP